MSASLSVIGGLSGLVVLTLSFVGHDPERKQSGGRIIRTPRFDDKTAFGFPSDHPAREPLRDLKLRSPKDYADSTTRRALFVKNGTRCRGLGCVTSSQYHPPLDIRSR